MRINNVIHFSTEDFGGAGSAALRVHKTCQEYGFNSILFCKNKRTSEESILAVRSILKNFYFRVLNKIDSKLNLFNDKYFFFEKNRNTLSDIKQIERHIPFHPNIIILHWISGFVDLRVIKQLQEKYNCKVYWYLMDMAPMTGGCHYAWDCIGYTDGCFSCPAVGFVYENLPLKTLQYKKQMIKNIGIEAISGSTWLSKQLNNSMLFKDKEIHEIMLGINSEVFKPLNEDNILNIKLKYNLPLDKKIIFFGASSTTDERKGFGYLIKALKLLSKDHLIDNNSVIIVTAGKFISREDFKNLTLPHKHIGYLNGNTELAEAYQIATMFVSPSIEDSGPMMINESIMCGTPVVSFKMGVAEDLVFNGTTGYIAELKNVEDLANGIAIIINLNNKKYKKMQENCREIGLRKCSTEVQVNKLISLMDDK
jgi:glycosyltransferase involved in cell wall biosynthesis